MQVECVECLEREHHFGTHDAISNRILDCCNDKAYQHLDHLPGPKPGCRWVPASYSKLRCFKSIELSAATAYFAGANQIAGRALTLSARLLRFGTTATQLHHGTVRNPVLFRGAQTWTRNIFIADLPPGPNGEHQQPPSCACEAASSSYHYLRPRRCLTDHRTSYLLLLF